MGMGTALPYPHTQYPLGTNFSPFTYPWVKYFHQTLTLMGKNPLGMRVMGTHCRAGVMNIMFGAPSAQDGVGADGFLFPGDPMDFMEVHSPAAMTTTSRTCVCYACATYLLGSSHRPRASRSSHVSLPAPSRLLCVYVIRVKRIYNF